MKFYLLRMAIRRSPTKMCGLSQVESLNLERVGNFATVFGELDHYLLVQPDIHLGGVVRIASVIQLLCQLFACRNAAVEIEQLHQVDNGMPPIELLLILAGKVRKNGRDIDLSLRCGRRRRGFGTAWAGGRRTGRLTAGAR